MFLLILQIVTVDSEIRRHLLLGRTAMENLDSILYYIILRKKEWEKLYHNCNAIIQKCLPSSVQFSRSVVSDSL